MDKVKEKSHLDIDPQSIIGKKFDMFVDKRDGCYWHAHGSERILKLYSPGNITKATVEIVRTFTEEEWKKVSDKKGITHYGFYERYTHWGEDKDETIAMI